jgi:hypothetical protein
LTASAIFLCLGLLLAIGIILPVITSEKAHRSLEESRDADKSNSEDLDTTVRSR